MAEENAILVNAYKASGSGIGSAIEPYIIDYKTFGTDSYVYNNKDILHEVYERADYCMNDTKLRQECFDYLNSIDEAGHALAGAYGISDADTLEPLGAMTAVAASSTAMTAVAASSTAMTAVAASSTAMTAVAASSTAMTAVAGSSTAMTAVAASSTAMTAVAASSTAMTAVAASSTAVNTIAKASVSTTMPFWKAANSKIDYVTAIYATITVGGYTLESQYSKDSVSDLNNICGNKSNTIIFTATGYYSNGNSTNVIINGTTVLSNSALRNTYQPRSVTSSNVGAVSVPTTTWTEKGDGYAAVAVYNLK
ncbi:MAG: hypothetical protein LKH21_01610 [Solobacterium sp.]|jgi:hypothetical protein|nr:hypothetical protein [Solobacterium sp.]